MPEMAAADTTTRAARSRWACLTKNGSHLPDGLACLATAAAALTPAALAAAATAAAPSLAAAHAAAAAAPAAAAPAAAGWPLLCAQKDGTCAAVLRLRALPRREPVTGVGHSKLPLGPPWQDTSSARLAHESAACVHSTLQMRSYARAPR